MAKVVQIRVWGLSSCTWHLVVHRSRLAGDLEGEGAGGEYVWAGGRRGEGPGGGGNGMGSRGWEVWAREKQAAVLMEPWSRHHEVCSVSVSSGPVHERSDRVESRCPLKSRP